jgi:hypothetical protein
MRLYCLLGTFTRLNSLDGHSAGQQQDADDGHSVPQNTLAKDGKPT